MRKKFVIIAFCILSCLVAVQGLFNTAKSDVTGAPAGYTGSPADGQSCTSCHSPRENFTGSGLISSNIPAAGYTASQTYTVTASITRLGHTVFGFEVSPQDTTSAGNIEGTIVITNTTKTQLASGIQGYITHKQAGTTGSGGSISWSFNWTAPATGHGPVVFYGAFNASNDNGQDSGDSIFLTSLKVYECTAPATPASITGASSICSGSTSTFSVPAGSAGTTYNWTLPSGWSGSSTTNTIIVTAGSGSGNISVSATNSCGTSGSVSKSVTITNSVSASISIAPSQNDICAGTQVTFSATGDNSGATPTYQWLVNGQTEGSNSSSYTSSAFVNGDVVSCVLTSSLTCVLNNPDTSGNVTMVVNPTITPSVHISPTDLTICADSTITFSASANNGGITPSYQWYQNGTSVNGATALVYTPASVGNNDVFSVQMTSDAACASPSVVTSNTDTVHVTQLLTPTISISSNQGNSICKNQSVTFSSAQTNGGNSPAYQWQKNGIDINGAVASDYVTDSLNNGDVIVVQMRSSVGCASPQLVTSNADTMQVNSVTPTATITSNSGSSICAAQQVIFSSDITGGGNNPVYQWQKNGLNISSARSSTYSTDSLANGDVISLKLSSNATCASPQNVQSNSITITVVSNAVPTVSITSSFGDSICAGQTGLLSAVQLNGGNSPVYQWLNNGDSIAGATTADYTPISITDNDSFSVELVSNSTCVTSNIAFSTPLVITVIPTVMPTLTVNLNGSDSICAGQNITFTASVQNAGPNPSFQWMDNGANISNRTGSAFSSSSLTDSSLISVLLTPDLMCASPPTLTSTPVLVHVLPQVQPTISIVSTMGDTVCAGQMVTFSASATYGGISPLYQWIKNDTLLSADTTLTYTTTTITNGDIIAVQLTSDAACALQSIVTSMADTLTVPPVVQSSVSISAGSDSVCPGTTVIFTAAIQSFGGTYSSPSFYWEKNGNSAGPNTSVFADTNVVNGETVSCQCASSSACLPPIVSNIITVTVYPTATPVITSQNDSLIATGAAAWQWLFNGQIINGATARVLQTDSAGVYSVLATDNNGCQSISDTFNFIPSGVNEPGAAGLFNIYPNPCDGLLNIDLASNTGDENLNVSIYNVSGKILLQQTVALTAPETKMHLDLNDFANGLYVLQISGRNTIAYRKFVIGK